MVLVVVGFLLLLLLCDVCLFHHASVKTLGLAPHTLLRDGRSDEKAAVYSESAPPLCRTTDTS